MRFCAYFLFFSFVFSSFISYAKVLPILLVYREDINFYQEMAQKLSLYIDRNIVLCPLSNWPNCASHNNYRYILVFGDLAYNKVLSSSLLLKNSKIFSFFVTKCNKKNNVCCGHLFPTLKEVVKILKKEFKNSKFLVLYTPKTKWWVDEYPSSDLSLFCLNVKDLKESLRKAFKNQAKVYILAPDLLFMHPAFLKDLVKHSFLFSKILVGLSSKMQQYGVPIVIFYDYDFFWSNFSLDVLHSQKLDIPIRMSIASWYSKN